MVERPEGANVGAHRGSSESRAFLVRAQVFRCVICLIMLIFHKGGYKKNLENQKLHLQPFSYFSTEL